MKNVLAGTLLFLAACNNMFEKKTSANAARLKAIMEETDKTWSFQPLIDILAADVKFKSTVPAGTPISGEFKGKEAVARYFNVILQDVAVFKQQIPMEFIEAGNRVIILGDDAYTLKKTGVTHRSPYAAIFTFEGGLIKDILIIQDLSGIWEAYREGQET